MALAATVGAALLGSAGPLLAQGETSFKARLSPVPITVQQTETMTGTGAVTATLSGSKLVVTGTFEGLPGPATVARVHRGMKTGVRGPALFELQLSTSTAGTLNGTFELTTQHIDDLRRGRFYIQVHSERAADGNLWGWLLPQETRR